MKSEMLLATSIAPYDIDKQKMAVSSWLKAGFHVISCNVREEIELLEEEFPEVCFAEMKRDGRDLLGKPYPYLYDMLQVLKEEKYEVCGLINSDIQIRDFNNSIINLIEEALQSHRLMFGRRMEVEKIGDTGTRYDLGIDFFLFRKELLEFYEDDGFFIGNCMWDYWFLYLAYVNGAALYEIRNPLFYHISHTIRWNKEVMIRYKELLGNKYFNGNREGILTFILKHLKHPCNGVFWCLPEVSSRTVLVVFPDNGNKSSLLSLKNQTHKNILIKDEKEIIETDIQQDYVFYSSGNVIYEEHFFEYLIHEMILHKKNAACSAMGIQEGLEAEDFYIYDLLSPYMNQRQYHLDVCYKTTELKNLVTCETWLSGYTLMYKSCLEWVKQIITEKISDRRFMIYPAGEYARKTVGLLQLIGCKNTVNFCNLVGLCDKNPEFWDTRYLDIPVYSPRQLLKYDSYDMVLIITCLYQEEIYKELTAILPEGKVSVF